MIQAKMIKKNCTSHFLCLPLQKENGWKQKAEKGWPTQVLIASTEAMEDLENLARAFNAGYSIVEKSAD